VNRNQYNISLLAHASSSTYFNCSQGLDLFGPSSACTSLLLETFETTSCHSMYSPVFSQRDGVIGVIPPPPGITPNFANPPSRAHAIITVHIVCTILSTLFTILRSYTAFFITRHVKVDDCKPSHDSHKRPLLTFIGLLLVAWVSLTSIDVRVVLLNKYPELSFSLWRTP
jgi:hypothetical protein